MFMVVIVVVPYTIDTFRTVYTLYDILNVFPSLVKKEDLTSSLRIGPFTLNLTQNFPILTRLIHPYSLACVSIISSV